MLHTHTHSHLLYYLLLTLYCTHTHSSLLSTPNFFLYYLTQFIPQCSRLASPPQQSHTHTQTHTHRHIHKHAHIPTHRTGLPAQHNINNTESNIPHHIITGTLLGDSHHQSALIFQPFCSPRLRFPHKEHIKNNVTKYKSTINHIFPNLHTS